MRLPYQRQTSWWFKRFDTSASLPRPRRRQSCAIGKDAFQEQYVQSERCRLVLSGVEGRMGRMPASSRLVIGLFQVVSRALHYSLALGSTVCASSPLSALVCVSRHGPKKTRNLLTACEGHRCGQCPFPLGRVAQLLPNFGLQVKASAQRHIGRLHKHERGKN